MLTLAIILAVVLALVALVRYNMRRDIDAVETIPDDLPPYNKQTAGLFTFTWSKGNITLSGNVDHISDCTGFRENYVYNSNKKAYEFYKQTGGGYVNQAGWRIELAPCCKHSLDCITRICG